MAKTEEKKTLKDKKDSKSQLYDEISGLREINEILTTMIYLLLCGRGEVEISKSQVSEGLGKYLCEIGQSDENYLVKVSLKTEDTEFAEVANEVDEI